MKIKLLLLSFCSLTFCFTGCQTLASASGTKHRQELTQLEGTWETIYFELDGIAQEICISDMTLQKSGMNSFSISGNGGINSYFGSAKISGTKFHTKKNLGRTLMAGDDRAMEFEDNFMAVLNTRCTWSITSDSGATQLTLKSTEKNANITFIKRKMNN